MDSHISKVLKLFGEGRLQDVLNSYAEENGLGILHSINSGFDNLGQKALLVSFAVYIAKTVQPYYYNKFYVTDYTFSPAPNYDSYSWIRHLRSHLDNEERLEYDEELKTYATEVCSELVALTYENESEE